MNCLFSQNFPVVCCSEKRNPEMSRITLDWYLVQAWSDFNEMLNMYSVASMMTAFSSGDSSFQDISGAFLTRLCLVLRVGLVVSLNASTTLSFLVLRQSLHCVALAGPELIVYNRLPLNTESHLLLPPKCSDQRQCTTTPARLCLNHLISVPVSCCDCGSGQSWQAGRKKKLIWKNHCSTIILGLWVERFPLKSVISVRKSLN